MSDRLRRTEFSCPGIDCTSVHTWPRIKEAPWAATFPLFCCDSCNTFIEIHAVEIREVFVGCVKNLMGISIRAFREYPDWVPVRVRSTLVEAVRSHEAAAWNGSAILARKAVELMAADVGARGQTLFHKIEDLKARRILPERVVGTDDVVRSLGNAAAHASEPEPKITAELKSGNAVLYAYDASKQIYLTRKISTFKRSEQGDQFARWLEPEWTLKLDGRVFTSGDE